MPSKKIYYIFLFCTRLKRDIIIDKLQEYYKFTDYVYSSPEKSDRSKRHFILQFTGNVDAKLVEEIYNSAVYGTTRHYTPAVRTFKRALSMVSALGMGTTEAGKALQLLNRSNNQQLLDDI
jgi:hypothetical protein